MWEKLKAALEAGIASEPDEAKRTATQTGIDAGLRKVRAEQAGEPVPAELTPTMKLKRKPIAAKYAAEIDALYAR